MSGRDSSVIEYRPSFVGRLARSILPPLQRGLPRSIYIPFYELLYAVYREVLRVSYLPRLAYFTIMGDERKRSRVGLTWRLLPSTLGGRKALENAFDVTLRVEETDVPGAIVECGVAQGGTAAMMALASERWGQRDREKWFFDSYEGLPEPTEEDYLDGKAGDFVRPLPKGACLGTIEQVRELMFDELMLPADRVFLVKGWFQETIPPSRARIGGVAILRLDGDWYESTKVPLENFYDQISIGGVVIVDDYATCYGSRRAVDEFLDLRGLSVDLREDGRGGVWFEKKAE
jgi:O-methyltransferase